jgi:hypothetical protein
MRSSRNLVLCLAIILVALRLISCVPIATTNLSDSCLQPSFSTLQRNDQEDLFRISENGKGGFINVKGERVIEPAFKELWWRFFDGFAAYQSADNNLWGYINSSGEIAIEPAFDLASNFSDGLSTVVIDGRHGAIDKTGKIVVEPLYRDITAFSDDRAFVMQGRLWRMIDKKGNYVTDNTFNRVNSFKEGLASFIGLNLVPTQFV